MLQKAGIAQENQNEDSGLEHRYGQAVKLISNFVILKQSQLLTSAFKQFQMHNLRKLIEKNALEERLKANQYVIF